MNLRLARHTNNLEAVVFFYTDILGLEVLGQFKDHSGYDGIFIGYIGKDWHLEFTTSAEAPQHHADDDDLLVFYPESDTEYKDIIARFTRQNIIPAEPKNPYWKANGITYTDPDGYRIVVAAPAPNS